jgi:hypothetical protein
VTRFVSDMQSNEKEREPDLGSMVRERRGPKKKELARTFFFSKMVERYMTSHFGLIKEKTDD